ncbi:MAG: YraN family protein [Polyangiaceae bacterium]|nr:YraN family protein [Polyangiaceae bacterium]
MTAPPRTAKTRAGLRADLGSRAEDAVADYLQALGIEIVERNLRVGRLEIDIVARDGDTILVVEVRTRGAGALQTAFGSIGHEKRTRIRRAGERLWNRRYSRDAAVARMRFDAASVVLPPNGDAPIVEYAPAAF